MFAKRNFSPQAFAGTAEYYTRYRPPYPEALLRDLVVRARLKGSGRLLDLACGPGRVTLPLAAHFKEVWGVDLEPEMIEAARKEALRTRVSNVHWSVGRAEDFQAPLGSFELVTISEAFHRVDQKAIADLIMGWLNPGGCVALMGSSGFWTGNLPWQQVVSDIVRRRLGEEPASKSPPDEAPDPFIGFCEQLLRDRGFSEVATHAFIHPYDWTCDDIVGYLFSTSFCSRRILGSGADAFAVEVKAALIAHDSTGLYHEDIRFGYSFGRKPD